MLKVLIESIHNRLVLEKGYRWIRTDETDNDLEAVKEAGKPSQFDPLQLRQGLFEALKTGEAKIQSRLLIKGTGTRNTPVAKVICIHSAKKEPAINWKLWATIFRAFGAPAGSCQGPMWRVILFCAETKRKFPPLGQGQGNEVGPAHVNGGYAYPNDPASIVIYREEEAARVLIHEMLHACGSDKMEHPEWKREVLTESWAELFLIAIQAGGSVSKGEALWKEQARWILAQESLLTQFFNVRRVDDYAYRYTVGRRAVMEKWGLVFEDLYREPRSIVGDSLRFTAPVLTGDD